MQCHCSQNRVCVARPRSSLGSERPSIFQNERYCRFKQNKERKEVSSELKSQRLSQRREAGGAQAKRWHWRRGNEVTHTPTLRETTHLARISAFRPSLDNRRRYVQERAEMYPPADKRQSTFPNVGTESEEARQLLSASATLGLSVAGAGAVLRFGLLLSTLARLTRMLQEVFRRTKL